MPNLTNKKDIFCMEYIVDFNGTQAAIRAGYSKKTAQEQSSRLLSNVMVQKRIAELMQARTERAEVNADYVLNRLVEIDKMDVLDIMNNEAALLPVNEWPESWRRYISGLDIAEMFTGYGDEREIAGLMKKIKWPDKVKNLELIGKHVDVQAWKEKVEHSGEVSLAQTISEARKRVASKSK